MINKSASNGAFYNVKIKKGDIKLITENISTLKIHKLTQAQYDRELAAGRIDENALYLTPDEEINLSSYELITVADIDEICGSIPEGILPQSDIDELIAQLK